MLIPFDSDAGQPDWGTLQNTSAGAFQLQEFLGADATSAVFRAEVASQGGASSVVKFYKIEQDSVAESQTEIWEEVKVFDHPNLIKVMGTGRMTLGESKFIYVAVEPADESLSSALSERRLEPAEAAEILTSTKSALQYLHNHGFIHSCLSPEQIFAVGDAIKLSTEPLRKPGRPQRLIASKPRYLAPESDEVNTSRAADVWCLGATLLEATTQQNISSGKWSAQAAPQELRSVVQRCLIVDPNLRTSLAQISQEPSMQQQATPVGNAQEPTPLLQTVRPEPPKTLYPLKAERTGLPFWAYAVAAVVLVAVLIWLLRPSSQPEKSAAPAKAVPAAQQRTLPPSEETNVAPPNVVQKPSPAQRESEAGTETKAPEEAPRADRATDARNGVNGDIWRVVVYTYDQEDAAKERAAQINKKDPQLNAAAFSPNGQSPFLVTVGGTMSRSDAKRFRDNAVRLGMPRDSYALNFTH